MANEPTRGEAPYLVIDGAPPTFIAYCAEVWKFREVAAMLIRRDLIIRFRQTYFGLAWLLFKPMALMAVMSFAFGFLAGFESKHSAPYVLIIFCGVIPWYFFSNSVPDAMNSLLGNLHIIQKTYFPRVIIPLAMIAVDAIEFFLAWILFVLGCIWFDFVPGWQILVAPLFWVQLLALCVGIGLWLAVYYVQFRDIGNLVPFLLTIGFFVTPVGYSTAHIPPQWQFLYSLNPLVGIIEGLRWSLLRGMDGFPLFSVLLSLAITIAICGGAANRFLAMEPRLVDVA